MFNGYIINYDTAFNRLFEILPGLLFDMEQVLIAFATLSSVQYDLNRNLLCKLAFKYALTSVGMEKFQMN